MLKPNSFWAMKLCSVLIVRLYRVHRVGIITFCNAAGFVWDVWQCVPLMCTLLCNAAGFWVLTSVFGVYVLPMPYIVSILWLIVTIIPPAQCQLWWPSSIFFSPNNRLYKEPSSHLVTTIKTFKCTLFSNRVNWIAKFSLQNSLVSQHSRNCGLVLPDSRIKIWVNAIAKKRLLGAISYYTLLLVLGFEFQYSNRNNNVFDISSTDSRLLVISKVNFRSTYE